MKSLRALQMTGEAAVSEGFCGKREEEYLKGGEGVKRKKIEQSKHLGKAVNR